MPIARTASATTALASWACGWAEYAAVSTSSIRLTTTTGLLERLLTRPPRERPRPPLHSSALRPPEDREARLRSLPAYSGFSTSAGPDRRRASRRVTRGACERRRTGTPAAGDPGRAAIPPPEGPSAGTPPRVGV